MTLHNHHMLSSIPCWSELDRDDPYYQVELTEEGHACQHDILYRVFGMEGDKIAARMLYGQVNMSPEARERKRLLAGSGAPCPDQVADMQRKGWETNSKRVVLIHIDTGRETMHPSLQEAARSINGSAGALCHVIKGDRKSHKGYTARYIG